MEKNETLATIERYLKIIAKSIVDSKVDMYVTDPTEKAVYAMTGNSKREDIVKKTGLSAGSISKLWNEWESKGILVKEGKTYKKVIE